MCQNTWDSIERYHPHIIHKQMDQRNDAELLTEFAADGCHAAFAALGQAMKPAIDERMAHTRSQLLEVFDAEVHERLRLQRQDTLSHLNQFSRRFWDLTRHVLAGQAWFDETQLSFDLPAPTAPSSSTPPMSFPRTRESSSDVRKPPLQNTGSLPGRG